MGFLDSLLGRSKPVKPDLDRLFALPTAAVTLEAAAGFTPTGLGSVCFRAPEGGAFAQIQRDVRELLDADEGREASVDGGWRAGRKGPVEFSTDSYGYTWLLARHEPSDVSGLVTDLHAVNSSLEAAGFGPHLLCSLVAFGRDDQRLGLVYLYKRGTFYPFAPLPDDPGAAGRSHGGETPGAAGRSHGGETQRDNALELQLRGAVGPDLPFEEDLGRWFPVWGAPGLK